MPTISGGITLTGGSTIVPPPPPPEFSSFTFSTADDIVRPADVGETYLYPNSKRGGVRTFKISDTKFVTIGGYYTNNTFSTTPASDYAYYCTLSTIDSSGVITQVNSVKLWDFQNGNTWSNESDCGFYEIYQFDTDKYGIAEFYGNCNGNGSQNQNSYFKPFTLNTTTGAATTPTNWIQFPKCDTSWSSRSSDADRLGGGVALDSTRLWTCRSLGAPDAVFTALFRYRTYHWIHTINWTNLTISSTANTIFNDENGQQMNSNDRQTNFLMPGGDHVMMISMTGGGNNIGALAVDVSGANPAPGNRNEVRFEAYGGTMLNTNVQSDGVGISSTLGTVFSEDVAGNICSLSWTISGNNVSYTGTSLAFGSTASKDNKPIHLGNGRVLLCLNSDGATGQTWTVAQIASDGTMTSTGTGTQNTNIESYPGINLVKLEEGKVLSVNRAQTSSNGSDGYIVT